jgi:teichuronic acid biosynthesis glycosyltransferase TuaC
MTYGTVPSPGKPSPLTILFVTSMHPSNRFPLRGVIIERLAMALRDVGHAVEFVKLGVGSPIRYLVAASNVADAIRRLTPDVIHVHFGYSGLAVPRTSVPIVTTFYGDDLNGTVTSDGGVSWKSRIGILVSQIVACRSTRCITVSAALRSRLWFSRTRAKTLTIRDAVDTRLFRPLSRITARDRLSVPHDEVLIIFPHDVQQPTKRVWLAQAAVDELRRWLPKARLWIVNGRPADEMPWYFAAADVMIVTSVKEGGPSSVKEALACGLRVVSVNVGDTQLFREVPEAMTCAAAQPADLAAGLREVLTRPSSERQSYLPEELSLPYAARQVSTVYRKAIAARLRDGRRGL